MVDCRTAGLLVGSANVNAMRTPSILLGVLVVSPVRDRRAVIDDILVLTSSLRTQGSSLAAVSSLAGIIGFRRVSGVKSP